MNNFLTTTYYHNLGKEYILAILIFVGILIILKIFKTIIIVRLKKLVQRSKTDFDDAILNIISNIKPPFYFLIALYLGIKSLVLPDLADKIVSGKGFASMKLNGVHGTWGKPVEEVFKEAEFPRAWHQEIAGYCKEIGIDFSSAPYDFEAVDLLVSLNV
ncbi:N-acetylneuraminate synthase family protein, partial [Patescibacteria group bacterium]|nr:N-acetylneuraminate synthase family protein [Patescibacteria group bacterium]